MPPQLVDSGSKAVEGSTSLSRSTPARTRILDTSYRLFSQHGTRAVGIDTIVEESGVAKMTLYRHFGSKDELVLAFLREREAVWTLGWLVAEVDRRAHAPRERMLAIFDVLDEWFRRDDFEGCSFVKLMLEAGTGTSPVKSACVNHLANVRAFVTTLATDAGCSDPANIARQWQMLMNGAMVAAAEGEVGAALRAREVAELILAAD
jgi:AcrR family transcriptional regulator